MKNRLMVIFLAFIFFIVPVSASEFILKPVSYQVEINGKTFIPKSPILSLNGNTTYGPFREMLEAAGMDVKFKDGKAVATNNVDNITDFMHKQYSMIKIYAQLPNAISQGSGFAVTDGYHIITNAHVVQGSNRIIGKNPRESTSYTFSIEKIDLDKDIAILKVTDRVNPYPTLTLGGNVDIGDGVISLGYPFNETMCISESGKVTKVTQFDGNNCIQNTAKTDPGSSGGALLNSQGEVIGITCGGSIISTNFAIPISEAKKLLSTLN